MGIAFWLVPPTPAVNVLKSLTSSPLPTDSGPSFHPHITIFTVPSNYDESQMQQALAHLTLSLPKYSAGIHIALKSLQTSDHYFRSVFVALDKTQELLEFREIVRAALDIEEGPGEMDKRTPMFPHLSLFYIDDAHAEDRGKIARHLQDTGHVRAITDHETIQLVANPTVDSGGISSFASTELWIVSYDGNVEDWQVVEKVSFARSEVV